MEKFNYIIVTSDNEWVSTGNDATDDELAQDILEIKERLKNEGKSPTTLMVHKGSFYYHTECI